MSAIRLVAPVAASPPPAPSRTPAFVGRGRELATLCRRLEAAMAGAGGVATLAGEPGVGKTRTAQELAVLARDRGCCVLIGHCYEGDWAPPFAP